MTRKPRSRKPRLSGLPTVAKAGRPYKGSASAIEDILPEPEFSMTVIRGAAAAVTGAASGIGRALAIELAARGCDLALADRDEAGLQAVAAEIAKASNDKASPDKTLPDKTLPNKASRKVTTHRVDVSDPQAIQDFAAAAIAAHPGLNIVVNNAGVALMGTFDEIDQAQMDWLMNINFWGVVHGTRAFLPQLARQREAHIVNLSSIFGIVGPPGQTAYCAAKFAVRGFSESLRHELQTANSPVRLSVVHPGGIATSIARNARAGAGITDNARRAQSIERFDNAARTKPERAAQIIADGIERNKQRILIGIDAKFIDVLQRLRPATYWKALAGIFNKRARPGVKKEAEA
jgi:short-subunit dehydrogenase